MPITLETIRDSPRTKHTSGNTTVIYGTQVVGALWATIGVKASFEERCSSHYELMGTNIWME